MHTNNGFQCFWLIVTHPDLFDQGMKSSLKTNLGKMLGG
jgi:hypothetical protein